MLPDVELAPEPPHVDLSERLALTKSEAARSLGVSLDYFNDHIASELKWVRRGRRQLVSVRQLEAWLEKTAAPVLP